MARRAARESEEQQAAELEKPDFERAIGIIVGSIKTGEQEGASIRGDLSAAWKVIEDDCHVNKQAAKLYARMAGMSDEIRDDFLRSLYGLMEAGGLGISADLVDQAEGNDAPEMPVVDKGPKKGLATLEKQQRQ